MPYSIVGDSLIDFANIAGIFIVLVARVYIFNTYDFSEDVVL